MLLMEKAEEKCKNIWEIILCNSFDEVKTHFFGENVSFEKDTIDFVLTEMMTEIYCAINYNGNVEHSAEEFARHLRIELENYKKNKTV
jgi:hypothetical protein